MLSSPPAGALANPVDTEARARFLAERPGSRKGSLQASSKDTVETASVRLKKK